MPVEEQPLWQRLRLRSGRVDRGPHSSLRRRLPGELLDLSVGLVEQHRQAGHDGSAGSCDSVRERGRPWIVDRVENHRRVRQCRRDRCCAGGRHGADHDGRRRCDIGEHGIVVSSPAARPHARVSAARSAERATIVTDFAPSPAKATTAGRDVPPAPTTVTACPDRSVRPTSSSAPRTPSTSVQSARHPVGVRSNVFAEPARIALSVRSSANPSAATLPGMVTDNPTQSGPKPSTRPGSCSAEHSMRS